LIREPRRWIQVALGIALLALLAWQGRHVAHMLPEVEAGVAALGIWGPVVFVLGVVLLSPLLFPDSILGLVAGFVFGLGAGTVYYFAGVYIANLAIFALGRTWLRAPIMRFAEGHPRAEAILRGARRDSLRLTALIRLVPVNIAFVSYLLGAGHFPWRAVLLGNLCLLPHLFLAVYIGDAAHHATTLSTRGPRTGYLEDVAMLLGLLAALCVVGVVTRVARRAMAELEADPD
jgi:uncharacterized membrane protein YdjX (TVP38/TMEM64 family)